MPRYHVNPSTGNAGTCKAKKKCPYGDLTKDHYDSREEAQAAYEKQAQACLKEAASPGKHPLALIPKAHQDVSTSDAFYTRSSEVDPEALAHLTAYNYYRQQAHNKNAPKVALANGFTVKRDQLLQLKALQALQATEAGRGYEGWGSDPWRGYLEDPVAQELPYEGSPLHRGASSRGRDFPRAHRSEDFPRHRGSKQTLC